MLSLKKDSTISSKVSEYDNVPVLPADYHNHIAAPFPVSLFDTQTELSHHHGPFSSSSPTSPVPTTHSCHVRESPPPVPRPLQFPTEENQTGFDGMEGKQQRQQRKSPLPVPRPFQFPMEECQTGFDSLEEKQQQQQKVGSDLDHRLALQEQKQPWQEQGQPKREGEPLECVSGRSVAILHHHHHQQQHSKPQRSHRESYGGEMSTTSSMVFYFLVFLAEILMFGVLSLVLFWVVYYRGGFAWREDVAKEFNYHPVLMITGFIFFMGHAMLVYRLYRCCNKLTAKILHTFLYLMAVPCIVVGTITVFDSHNLRVPPIPNLYSLHSWLGVVTIGLFALQLVVGFFSFWILLCCEQGTAKFRAGLVPVHATFGIITFMLAIATAVTGYTEKAFFSLSNYSQMPDEAWVINAQATCLAGLAILMGFLLYSTRYARSKHPVAIVDPPSSSHYVMTQKTYYYRDHE